MQLEFTSYTLSPEDDFIVVPIRTISDEVYELDESFTVSISAELVRPDLGQTTVTIINLDSQL